MSSDREMSPSSNAAWPEWVLPKLDVPTGTGGFDGVVGAVMKGVCRGAAWGMKGIASARIWLGGATCGVWKVLVGTQSAW